MKATERVLPATQRTCLDAALGLIAERGPRGFVLKDVARRAQIDLITLQQEFVSLDELLLAVAIEGFAQMAVQMEKECALHRSSSDRLQYCAASYVRFALHWPAHFAIMFEMPRSLQEQRSSEPRHMNAFGVLIRIVEQAQAEGVLPDGDAARLAISYWAFVHGLAKLSTSGTLPLPEEQMIALAMKMAGQMTKGLQAD